MDKQKFIKQPKSTIDSYVFKHHINRVWDIIKDAYVMQSIFEDTMICQNVTILKGNNTYDVGNIFTLLWRSILQVTYEVESVSIEDDFRQIRLKCIKTVPFDMRFTYIYSLYTTTIDNYTLMIMEILHEQVYFSTVDQKKMGELERKEVLTVIDNYLNQSVKDLYQVESVIIKTNINRLWSIITNWVEFRKLVPVIADRVVYLGDPLKKDSKLLLKWTNKNIECYLKVEEVRNEGLNEDWVYSMQCYDGIPKPPIQNLIFTLNSVCEEIVFLEFKHVFHEPIKYDIMKNISQDKKKILQELRNKLESFKEN
jgi:hypothetical protein